MTWSELGDTEASASSQSDRQLVTELELAVDAKSVYAAIEAKETKTPVEAS